MLPLHHFAVILQTERIETVKPLRHLILSETKKLSIRL